MQTTYEKIDELLLQHGLSTKEMKSPSLNMAEAWSIVEYLNNQAEQYTYTKEHYLFQGPTFKPSNHYLEEYTLGSTCWYMYVEGFGYRRWICTPWPAMSVCLAALYVVHEPIRWAFEELDIPLDTTSVSALL